MIVGVFSQNVLFQYNTKHLKHTGGGQNILLTFYASRTLLKKKLKRPGFQEKLHKFVTSIIRLVQVLFFHWFLFILDFFKSITYDKYIWLVNEFSPK